MKNKKINNLILNAIIASLYVAFTFLFSPFSYSTKLLFIELRISEIFILLSFYNNKYNSGLIIGCFLANFLGSSLGMIDWIIGTFQTFISVIVFNKLAKLSNKRILNLTLGIIINSFICGVIIGLELTYVYFVNGNSLFYFFTQFIGVFLGELIVLIIGSIILETSFKNKALRKNLEINF